MTVPAQRKRDVSSAHKVLSVAHPAGDGADVAGHGLLSKVDSGCRCGWCASRARPRRLGRRANLAEAGMGHQPQTGKVYPLALGVLRGLISLHRRSNPAHQARPASRAPRIEITSGVAGALGAVGTAGGQARIR